ncbi:histone H2B.2-like [Rhodamnia argentea]|uniref:Histone H2B.2-like n=1 Tax=Rhodamnia argentea TaxID=178133 RepID=A0A8B8NJA0_9MYRT|nr:histone H2B.2-like [Rhodamnia argentea]
MAPKRKAKVIKTTRKVVQETVEVALVAKDQKLGAESDEMLQEESESEVVKTTVTVEGELPGGAEQATVEIPIEQPPRQETVTEAPRMPRQPETEAKDKTHDQKTTRDAKEEDREEREEDEETQSPEGTPRAAAEREAETLKEEPALDGERKKAQGTTERERPAERTEEERSPEKDAEAEKKPKRAREEDEKARVGRRRRRRRVGDGVGAEQYKRYVFRVLKQVHPGLGISSAAMEVLNAYMNDMFERLAAEAARLSNYAGIKTLTSRDIQGAVRLVLPGELGRHAIAEGAKAVMNYMEHDGGGGGAKSKP